MKALDKTHPKVPNIFLLGHVSTSFKNMLIKNNDMKIDLALLEAPHQELSKSGSASVVALSVCWHLCVCVSAWESQSSYIP